MTDDPGRFIDWNVTHWMPLPNRAAASCLSIYQDDAAKDFDFFQSGDDNNHLIPRYGIRVNPATGDVHATFCGTRHNFGDWIRNLSVAPVQVPEFGHVHSGFWAGATDVAHRIIGYWNLTGSHLYLYGHSLGAARARLVAAQLRAWKVPADKIKLIVFGEPHPGFRDFMDWWAAQGIETLSYRREVTDPWGIVHPDVVTQVPLDVEPFSYCAASPFTPLLQPERTLKAVDVLYKHGMEYYAAQITAEAAKPSGPGC